MAALNDADSQALSDLLAKLGIEDGNVKSLEDLQTLVKPKKIKIKREHDIEEHSDYEDNDNDGDKKGATPIPATLPKLTWFCGTTPIRKGHTSFVAWKHEVEGLRNIYPENIVVQAMRRSLRSPAVEDTWHLGQDANYKDIMEALEIGYGDVTEAETLMSELYSTMQGEKESLTEFVSRLRSLNYKLANLPSSHIKYSDELIISNFFRGLRDDKIREVLRPRKDEMKSVNEILREARRLESDQSRCKPPKVKVNALTVKEQELSDRDWLEERFQKMELKIQNDVKAQIALVQMTTQRQWGDGRGRGRGGFRGRGRGSQNGYRGAYNQTVGTPREQEGTQYETPPQQEHNNQNDAWDPSQIICHNCGGVGHYQYGCAARWQIPNIEVSGRGGRR